MTINSDKIEKYFSELTFRNSIIKEYQKQNDLFLSSKFCVFEYICPDENRLSDIIADLLNPKGKHGQNNIFLIEFLKIINRFDLNQQQNPNILREYCTTLIKNEKRRMDILIEWPGKFGIMIENKPWASDQSEQLIDYKKDLDRRFGNKQYLIIYLTITGALPSNESISKEELKYLENNNQFLGISYEKDLYCWGENCIKECKSEKIRWFLKEFLYYIENNL